MGLLDDEQKSGDDNTYPFGRLLYKKTIELSKTWTKKKSFEGKKIIASGKRKRNIKYRIYLVDLEREDTPI